MECSVAISHLGEIVSPLSLFTLLTSLAPTNISLKFNYLEFPLDFQTSLTIFTPSELENLALDNKPFCDYEAANNNKLRAWLSVCNPDRMEMVLRSPLINFTLDYNEETFNFISEKNERCDQQWESVSEGYIAEFRVSDKPYIPQTLPDYYENFKHLLSRPRYVELAVFGDYSFYEKYGQDMQKSKDRLLSIIKLANSYFNVLRMEFQVVHLFIADSPDIMPINFNTTNLMFKSFGEYLANYTGAHYDHATLITRISEFEYNDPGVNGMSPLAKICAPENKFKDVSWFTDDSGTLKRIAHTFAHELGHNLGMEHDKASEFGTCECPVGSCFEGAHDASVDATHWSNCSLAYLDKMYRTGADYCLWNKPEKTIFSPECGNGIIDDGEDCDCGSGGCIAHDCCDPTTCKLRENAECFSGSCCDLSTCSISTNASILCRTSKTSCDPPEFCDGENSECPEDEIYENGVICPDDNEAFCYDGRCASRTVQCKEIWGEEAEASSDECYQKAIDEWDECEAKNNETSNCSLEEMLCGKLYCEYPENKSEKNMYGWDRDSWDMDGNSQCNLLLANYQKDYYPLYYIGGTPDGTTCGNGKYCLNRACVAKTEILGCQLKNFFDEEQCANDNKCSKPSEIESGLQCDSGLELQAELNDGEWITISTVECTDDKYEIKAEGGEKMEVFAVAFRCIQKE